MPTYKGYTGQIELDADQLVLKRTGIAATLAGLTTTTVPLTALSGVRVEAASAAKNGSLQLELGRIPAPAPSASDPYTVLFTHRQRKAFQELAELLRERAAENLRSGPDPAMVEFERLGAKEDLLTARERRQAEKAARTLPAAASFAGITLGRDEIVSPWGGGPILGARATVDTAGQLTRRISLTRVAMTGPLAFAWRKKIDDRELYLVIEGYGWAISAPVDPKKSEQARTFAARINAAGADRAPRPPLTPDSDPVEQIRKLAELRDAGAISADDFEAKKAELLARV